MNIKYIDKIGQFFYIKINKCITCDYGVDHCDWGCPKGEEKEEIISLQLEKIIIEKSNITYVFKKDKKFINVKEKQIIGEV